MEEIIQKVETGIERSDNILDLSNMGLTSLPKQVFEISSIRELYLHNNQLETLPEQIKQLRELRVLNVSNNNLRSIPNEIVHLKSVLELNLNGNKFDNFPKQVCSIDSLSKLYIGRNKIKSVLPEIANLINLKVLSLHANRLHDLPNEIDQLGNLEILMLNENLLASIPKEIGKLSKLREFHLRNNMLNSLPKEMMTLSQLYRINLKENDLSIPPEILDKEFDPHTILDYYFEITTRSENSVKCVANFSGYMGPQVIGTLASSLMNRWDPELIVMVGIAGSISDKVLLGDVVVPNQIDAYFASTAAGDNKNKVEFEHAGEIFRAPHDLIEEIRHFQYAYPEHFDDWQKKSRNFTSPFFEGNEFSKLFNEELIRELPQIKIGHLASGPVKVESKIFGSWLKERDSKIIAVEMEAAGLASAAYTRKKPSRLLVLRGVSDFGDSRKEDFDALGNGIVRKYAMNNTAQLLWLLIYNERLK